MKEWLNTHYIMIFFTDSKYQILDLPVSSPLGGPDFKQDILVGGNFFLTCFVVVQWRELLCYYVGSCTEYEFSYSCYVMIGHHMILIF